MQTPRIHRPSLAVAMVLPWALFALLTWSPWPPDNLEVASVILQADDDANLEVFAHPDAGPVPSLGDASDVRGV